MDTLSRPTQGGEEAKLPPQIPGKSIMVVPEEVNFAIDFFKLPSERAGYWPIREEFALPDLEGGDQYFYLPKRLDSYQVLEFCCGFNNGTARMVFAQNSMPEQVGSRQVLDVRNLVVKAYEYVRRVYFRDGDNPCPTLRDAGKMLCHLGLNRQAATALYLAAWSEGPMYHGLMTTYERYVYWKWDCLVGFPDHVAFMRLKHLSRTYPKRQGVEERGYPFPRLDGEPGLHAVWGPRWAHYQMIGRHSADAWLMPAAKKRVPLPAQKRARPQSHPSPSVPNGVVIVKGTNIRPPSSRGTDPPSLSSGQQTRQPSKPSTSLACHSLPEEDRSPPKDIRGEPLTEGEKAQRILEVGRWHMQGIYHGGVFYPPRGGILVLRATDSLATKSTRHLFRLATAGNVGDSHLKQVVQGHRKTDVFSVMGVDLPIILQPDAPGKTYAKCPPKPSDESTFFPAYENCGPRSASANSFPEPRLDPASPLQALSEGQVEFVRRVARQVRPSVPKLALGVRTNMHPREGSNGAQDRQPSQSMVTVAHADIDGHTRRGLTPDVPGFQSSNIANRPHGSWNVVTSAPPGFPGHPNNVFVTPGHSMPAPNGANIHQTYSVHGHRPNSPSSASQIHVLLPHPPPPFPGQPHCGPSPFHGPAPHHHQQTHDPNGYYNSPHPPPHGGIVLSNNHPPYGPPERHDHSPYYDQFWKHHNMLQNLTGPNACVRSQAPPPPPNLAVEPPPRPGYFGPISQPPYGASAGPVNTRRSRRHAHPQNQPVRGGVNGGRIGAITRSNTPLSTASTSSASGHGLPTNGYGDSAMRTTAQNGNAMNFGSFDGSTSRPQTPNLSNFEFSAQNPPSRGHVHSPSVEDAASPPGAGSD